MPTPIKDAREKVEHTIVNHQQDKSKSVCTIIAKDLDAYGLAVLDRVAGSYRVANDEADFVQALVVIRAEITGDRGEEK